MSEQHSRVALHGEVVAAIPGDRFVVARVRLLRCGSSLPCILIDLRLPSFGCRGADRRVSLAQHVPADQQRSKTLGDIVVPAKLFATPAQLRDGAFKPKSRLGQEADALEHGQERGDHHAEGDPRRLDVRRDPHERRATVLSEVDKPSSGGDDDEPCAAFSRSRGCMIDLVGVSRSGNRKDERPLSHAGGNFVGALHQDRHRDRGRADGAHDLTRGFAGSHSEDDDVVDIRPLRKSAKVAGRVGAEGEMVGERKSEIEERRCVGRSSAHRYSTVGNAERRPPSWRMVWPVT